MKRWVTAIVQMKCGGQAHGRVPHYIAKGERLLEIHTGGKRPFIRCVECASPPAELVTDQVTPSPEDDGASLERMGSHAIRGTRPKHA